ncbi:hypothetical protein ACQ4M3_15570 [Leptolyngbya sp. AN03gr2]|uniref:hypothetical protein n=1 Tax=unclassified Leptolyngbya TaxID=2650499 RepID=UPI003D31E655
MKIWLYVVISIALVLVWIPLATSTGMPKISLILAGCIVGGAYGLLASLFNWNTFFEVHPVDGFVAKFGRKKVRGAYFFGSSLLLFVGLMFAWFVVDPQTLLVYVIYFYIQVKKLFGL